MNEETRPYFERRYVDIKEIVLAMISVYPPESLDENGVFMTLQREFDWLADELGYESTMAMLDRLIANEDDDDWDDLDDWDFE